VILENVACDQVFGMDPENLFPEFSNFFKFKKVKQRFQEFVKSTNSWTDQRDKSGHKQWRKEWSMKIVSPQLNSK
jgi:hypothetical protein